MPMNPQDAINTALNSLKVKGFDFSNAPMGQAMIEELTKAILQEVLKATVSVPSLGLVAPPNGGPVTGSVQGTIS